MGRDMLLFVRDSFLVCVVWVFVLVALLSGVCQGGEKIDVLIAGNQIAMEQNLRAFFDSEPAVRYHFVPARDPGGAFGFSQADLVKMIRLYFPRYYQDLKAYDLLILTSPDFNLFTRQQDRWMYDAITEGMGGINDLGVFSIVSGIAESWSISETQRAFPNDAPAVTAKGCGEAPYGAFRVVVNRQVTFPILTPFIAFGVEDVIAQGCSRMVIHREGSEVLAWQVGNFGSIKVDYIAAWEYDKGRTITNGNAMGACWQGYPRGPEDNQYSPGILMNMVYWLSKRNLIDDIEVFHRVKSKLAEYRSRMVIVISLMDFIDKFGANTDDVQKELIGLRELYSDASQHYMDQEFVECEELIQKALESFSSVEELARREKDRALLWVYMIEWLAASSTLFFSGYVLWTLMVRRRLYRQIDTTKLRTR